MMVFIHWDTIVNKLKLKRQVVSNDETFAYTEGTGRYLLSCWIILALSLTYRLYAGIANPMFAALWQTHRP